MRVWFRRVVRIERTLLHLTLVLSLVTAGQVYWKVEQPVMELRGQVRSAQFEVQLLSHRLAVADDRLTRVERTVRDWDWRRREGSEAMSDARVPPVAVPQ